MYLVENDGFAKSSALTLIHHLCLPLHLFYPMCPFLIELRFGVWTVFCPGYGLWRILALPKSFGISPTCNLANVSSIRIYSHRLQGLRCIVRPGADGVRIGSGHPRGKNPWRYLLETGACDTLKYDLARLMASIRLWTHQQGHNNWGFRTEVEVR